MLLLEIAAQGLRGLPPAARYALRAGHNVVSADGDALRRILELAWRPDAAPEAGLASSAGVARVGLTFIGNDRVTWRVVRDLTGPCQLLRFDPSTRAFGRVEQDGARVAALLRDEAGVPGPEHLAGWLVFTSSDLPSRAAPARALGGALPRQAPARAPAASHAASPDDVRRRRSALQDELVRSRDAGRLQQQLDGLQTSLFRMEEQLKAGDQLRDRLRATEEGVRAMAGAREALAPLGDPDARIVAHDRATARRDEALAKLAAERGSMEEEGAGVVLAPPWSEGGFLAGVAVALLALVGGAVSTWGAIALLAIPAAGGSALIALRWISAEELRERRGRRRLWLDDRERKIRQAWERETADVRGAVTAAGVATARELRDLWDRLREAEAVLEGERRRLAEWEEKPETHDLAEQRVRLQAEIGEVEARLTAQAGGYVRAPEIVEQELARLEAGAASAVAGEARGAAPVEEGDAELERIWAEGAPAAASRTPADPVRALLARASAETGLSPGEALRGVQQRVSMLLAALSGQRFTGVLVDERGNLSVHGGGRGVPVATLTPTERDACYVALRLAFLEGAIAGGRAVALLANPFGSLSEGMRSALARQLQQVARAGQVVHATGDLVFKEAADHSA